MKQYRRKSPTTHTDFNLISAIAFSDEISIFEIAEITGIDPIHAYNITSCRSGKGLIRWLQNLPSDVVKDFKKYFNFTADDYKASTLSSKDVCKQLGYTARSPGRIIINGEKAE